MTNTAEAVPSRGNSASNFAVTNADEGVQNRGNDLANNFAVSNDAEGVQSSARSSNDPIFADGATNRPTPNGFAVPNHHEVAGGDSGGPLIGLTSLKLTKGASGTAEAYSLRAAAPACAANLGSLAATVARVWHEHHRRPDRAPHPSLP